MAIIYVRGWAGEEDFPIPPQIVENGNAFPAYDGEEFAVQFDYSWYGNDPTAAAFARVIWRDENDNVISTTEWPLPATSGFVHVAYSVIAPAGVAIGRLQFEGPDIGGPEDRPGRYVGFQRPDVRRVLITADSVPGTALLDGAVTPEKIADGAVVPGKIALGRLTDENLDDVSETGQYVQIYSGEATSGRSYPSGRAGFLEVLNSDRGSDVGIIQRYTDYQNADNVWSRAWYNSWGPWTGGDTGWVNVSSWLNSGFSGTLQYMKIGVQIYLRADVTGTFGPYNTSFATTPPSLTPSNIGTGGAFMTGGDGDMAVAYVTDSSNIGVRQLSTTTIANRARFTFPYIL